MLKKLSQKTGPHYKLKETHSQIPSVLIPQFHVNHISHHICPILYFSRFVSKDPSGSFLLLLLNCYIQFNLLPKAGLHKPSDKTKQGQNSKQSRQSNNNLKIIFYFAVHTTLIAVYNSVFCHKQVSTQPNQHHYISYICWEGSPKSRKI